MYVPIYPFENHDIYVQVGVLFNDCSKMVLDMAGNELTYLEKDEKEHYFDMESFPETLTKKVRFKI